MESIYRKDQLLIHTNPDFKGNNEKKRKQFDKILRQEGWSLNRVQWRIKFLLDGFDIHNKRVLDMGCGRGTFSIYLALSNARYVVGIDPEKSGSSKGVSYIMPRRIEELGLMNCKFMPVALGEHKFSDGSFDLILSYNSINHLYEVTSDIRYDATAYDIFLHIFKELYRITAPGGMLIISDCSRINLFSWFNRYNIPNPIPGCKKVEW